MVSTSNGGWPPSVGSRTWRPYFPSTGGPRDEACVDRGPDVYGVKPNGNNLAPPGRKKVRAMATQVQVEGVVQQGREYRMPAQQSAEALAASMKLNGIDRLWFVSGSELAFFQESAVKHRMLGRPAPQIMTMTHENA